jgi:hypothetical protein
MLNGRHQERHKCIPVAVSECNTGPVWGTSPSVVCWALTVMEFVELDCVWNAMAHAQKPDFVFRRNRPVHLNRQGRQFSRLLAAEVCASAVVMLDTIFRGSVKGTGYPLNSLVSPSLPLPCVTVCHHISTQLYHLNSSTAEVVLWVELYIYHLSVPSWHVIGRPLPLTVKW